MRIEKYDGEKPSWPDLWSQPCGTVVVTHDVVNIVCTLERSANGSWCLVGESIPVPTNILALMTKLALTVAIIPPPDGWNG